MKTALYTMLANQKLDAKFVVLCLLLPGGNYVLCFTLGRYLLRFFSTRTIRNKTAA